MITTKQDISKLRRRYRRLTGAIGVLLVLGLVGAPSAWAEFEQVGTFAEHGEGALLEQVSGIAVNTTGAGGVPAGTLYTSLGAESMVARYGPEGEFSEAWGWRVSKGALENHFERCGPDGEPGKTCANGGSGGEGEGRLYNPIGIAVDQTTGYVYVFNEPSSDRLHNVIQVFSADGSQVIDEFGETSALEGSLPGGTFTEEPERVHGTTKGGIAVDASGNVYLADIKRPRPAHPQVEQRIMIFKPQSAADYEHYVYAGQNSDITKPDSVGRLAVDQAGNLYTAGEFNLGTQGIEEFDPNAPGTPICEFRLPAGGIAAMTVNPVTGEPFYFNSKTRKMFQLSACTPDGTFVPKSSFTVSPKTESIVGLAFTPNRTFSPSRPAGVLYSVDQAVHLGDTPSETIVGLGEIFAPAEASQPSVESESVTSVTSSSAALQASINPRGFATRYTFQYLTEAEYEANEPGDRFAGAAEAPLGGAALGNGQQPLSAGTTVAGLQPDTAYRFRVLASNCQIGEEGEQCEAVGADAAFRTFPVPSFGLPDGRRYELVSPVQKNAGEVFPLTPGKASCGSECKPGAGSEAFPRQSAPDGNSVVFEGQSFSTSEGATVYNEYLAKRTGSGWKTTVLAPRLMGSNEEGYRAFTADLSQGVLLQRFPSLTPDAPSEVPNLYTQPTANPSALTPLIGSEPPHGSISFKLKYSGASADFSRRFFAANDALTGPTDFAPEAVYVNAAKYNLYEESEGELRLINVLPGNAGTVPGASFGAAPLGTSNYTDTATVLSHAISEDGSRVFWSDEAGQVYVREDGERTIEIPDSSKFLTASADGSEVLLQDGHIYNLETEAVTDLTEGQGGFLGILGQNDDLTHLYFVDTAALTGGQENEYGAKAEAGENNLYSWQGGVPTFVATLASGDNLIPFALGGDWHFSPSQRTAEASSDGRWVAFLSTSALTREVSAGPCGGCTQVYLYNSDTGKLSCPSCNPTGEAAIGTSSLPMMDSCCGVMDPRPQPRYLTNEGRLYFDSQDSLTPLDTNNGIEDVYQFEPQGVGTCEREGGCVDLISAGNEPVDSNFLAIDQTGKNVFFTTRDRLVLPDRDSLVDLYVAREGGGIPSESESPRSECQGEACQAPAAVLNDPTPGSSSFEGAGNVKEKAQKKKHKKKKQKHKKKHKKSKSNRGGAR